MIDAGSAAAALHKALSALGPHGAYSSPDAAYGGGYVDPGELRAAGSGVGGGGTAAETGIGETDDSFYGAYIIRPSVVERSTIDSRACQGNTASRLRR